MKLIRSIQAIALCLALHSAAYCADDFQSSIQPLLKERCNSCHSTKKQKGDLDLERFASVADIKREPMIWEGVLEQIHMGEMPPKKEPQLSTEQKTLLTKWVQDRLEEVALASAGDPGPVVLRRLSNMEYTYTLRDLTGVDSLDPAKEFPVDGAAGEGFTNAGAALVMSPALLSKYLDAAKDIASHAVLTPQGMHFSPSTSPSDWTEETLEKIRALYSRYSESVGQSELKVQGTKVIAADDGRLPLAKYLAALQGRGDSAGLSPKYLRLLKETLTGSKPSLLLDPLRAKFRAGTLATADVAPWQHSLWRFASVGHIGKQNGPKAWQEPVTPLVAKHEIRMKLSAPKDGGDVTLYLTTTDAGDGTANDAAIWENARLVAPGRADMPLRHVPQVVQRLEQQRVQMIASVAKCLAAAHEVQMSVERTDVAKLAQKHGVDAALLAGWLDYLGIGSSGTVKLEPLLTKKVASVPNYNFIQGWTGEQALSVLANSSDESARTPGLMKAHSVATHPSPSRASVIAWRSPVSGPLHIHGDVADAHPECGNGITWGLEVRRGHTREVLASGVSKGAAPIPLGPFEKVRVREGDVVVLVIGPRDGNHTCDLTAVNLTLSDGQTTWDLAKDVSPNILAGNPHGVWHFLSQPAKMEVAPAIPGGSLLTQWRKNSDATERQRLAQKVQQLLERGLATVAADSPNRALHSQLLSFNGPLLAAALNAPSPKTAASPDYQVQAPSVIEVKLPASLVDGAELVVTGRLLQPEGSVQMQVLTTKPEPRQGLAAVEMKTAEVKGMWSDNNLHTNYSAPVIVTDNSAARRRFEAAFDEFRSLFPIALCYAKIVPVDEVVTLTLFHREDDQLQRLMLEDAQIVELDRLWDELRCVSEWPLKQVDVFEQLFQFATQDAKPSAFEPMREPISRAAEAFRRQLVESEPKQIQAALEFAARAWRRPLSTPEKDQLRTLYQTLRKQELPHAAAVRMLIARVLMAPAFLYRGEKAAPGSKSAPVNDHEIATRLSYFLWASTPDAALKQLASDGKLHDPAVLAAQARRMLKDERIRRLATEFGCQWLHVRDVDTLDEKSERHFPTFISLRGDMKEEVVRFFIDLFQNDRSVLSLLNADHTFVNASLAKHYALDVPGDGWQRFEGLQSKGRGGILGFAATLAKQSGASRTSAILRGTWLSEVILGDKLPIPPKGVPVLPEEAPAALSERQLIERHSRDENCSGCHRRIDPFGFALEGFDAIGRARPADTKTVLPDGTSVDGISGLRDYLLNKRSDDFLRQFCRKLLGYALGRSVQLSDRPLIDSMVRSDRCIGTLIDLIVRSPQFREVRGKDAIAQH
jgi:Protein of unknown function (DUF1592)/Protein of unknown function (DUF1588)/Protein of unknown function (DUF1587)/Protein of unknown function (DUF1585)/Protein of unknown function (DUF1595)/Planctomycete cytochrome C